jgi:hypothetical protein
MTTSRPTSSGYEPDEIEIGPAALRAGVLALCDYDPAVEPASKAVSRIFTAMFFARLDEAIK